METKKSFWRYVFIVPLFLMGCLIINVSCQEPAADNRVQQAYELRMNGNADSALAILAVVITEDSTNSMALYELARTEHHIGLGNPNSLFKNLGNIRVLIDKAVEFDSDNVIYRFYQGYIAYLEAYIAFMRQQEDVSDKVKDVVSVYESVLEHKPDYYESELYLVEILSVPVEMGGDSLKAQQYVNDLIEKDPISGAKAKELLLPKTVNRIQYWKGVLDSNPGNPEVLEQLGKAYLYADSVTKGIECLEEAIDNDIIKNVVLLDIARFYLMSSQGDSLKMTQYMPEAETAVNRYLQTNPVAPLKAYAHAIMAFVKEGQGKQDEVNVMREKALAIDRNVSKAFGLPPLLLFSKPDEISHYYGYFSRPF